MSHAYQIINLETLFYNCDQMTQSLNQLPVLLEFFSKVDEWMGDWWIENSPNHEQQHVIVVNQTSL